MPPEETLPKVAHRRSCRWWPAALLSPAGVTAVSRKDRSR